VSDVFDPTKNESLDEGREASAAYVGDQLLERVGLKGRVFFAENGGQYWMQDANGEWRGRQQKLFESYLKPAALMPSAMMVRQ